MKPERESQEQRLASGGASKWPSLRRENIPFSEDVCGTDETDPAERISATGVVCHIPTVEQALTLISSARARGGQPGGLIIEGVNYTGTAKCNLICTFTVCDI